MVPIELPSAATVTEIQFRLRSRPPVEARCRRARRRRRPWTGPPPVGTFPRGYRVQLSMDGSTWGAPVAEGQGSGLTTMIAFSPAAAKFIRITQTGTAADNAPGRCSGSACSRRPPRAGQRRAIESSIRRRGITWCQGNHDTRLRARGCVRRQRAEPRAPGDCTAIQPNARVADRIVTPTKRIASSGTTAPAISVFPRKSAKLRLAPLMHPLGLSADADRPPVNESIGTLPMGGYLRRIASQNSDRQVRIWRTRWERGADARWSGTATGHNPYPAGSLRASAWSAGWSWAEHHVNRRKPEASRLAHPYRRSSDTLVRLVRRANANAVGVSALDDDRGRLENSPSPSTREIVRCPVRTCWSQSREREREHGVQFSSRPRQD